MFRYGYGLHHGPGVFAWVVLALVVAALVVGIVALVRLTGHPRSGAAAGPLATQGPPLDPAFAELRLRYAKGDITWEEYVQRAADLGFPTVPGAGPRSDPNRSPTPPPAP
jgi:putative membrane protein